MRAALPVLVVLLAGCSGASPPPPTERPSLVVMPPDAATPAAAPTSNVDDVTDPTLPDRWKDAAYFNHMKKAVYRVWDPISVYKRLPASATRNLPPTVAIVLHVVLRPDGSVDSVTVKTSSTILELDTEGVRAFREAGPFAPVPDPPPKLDFDFTLYFELDHRASMPQ